MGRVRRSRSAPGEAVLNRPERPLLAMLTISLGAWLFMLSGGIANIALPRLALELDVPEAEIVWLSVAFQIAAVSLTIPLAAVSEVIGIRRVYVGGLVVYMLGGALCGLATGFTQLALARVLQGLGAAGISSVNAALIRRIVPRHQLGRGIAIMSVVIGAAQGAAPIVGSFILSVANWRWLFFYDMPLGILAVWLALRAIPPDSKSDRRLDFVSAALCIPALGLSFFALDRVARAPSGTAGLVALGVGLTALVLLILRQRGRPRPLFPVDLFRLPRFALPSLTSVSMYAAQGLGLTALPFVLVRALNLPLIEAGVLISVMPLATLFTAPVAGFCIDRFPRSPFGALGAIITGSGFGLAHFGGAGHSRLLVMIAIVMMGIGFALFQNHNAKAMILGAPPDRMGAAGGVQSTARVIGSMLGPALVGISFHAFGEHGATISLTIGIGLAVAGALAGLLYAWIARRPDDLHA